MCLQEKSLGSKLDDLTRQCLGAPFKEHGRSIEEGFDCYGLFLWIIKQLGYNIPDFEYESEWFKKGYNYFMQNYWKFADEIAKNELRGGDVILFKNCPETVNHIAMYLGNGKFLHCSREAGVIVSRLNQQPFCRRMDSFYRLKT